MKGQERKVMDRAVDRGWTAEGPRVPSGGARPARLCAGSKSVEMRQATDRSGITHSSHCSLPFMPGLAEILLLIWDILFCF